MSLIRRNRYLTLCTRLLAAAVLLRSFIAPGFMLSVSADDGLGMVFCNGPVANIHAHDSAHSGHHHGDNGDSGQASHVTPLCGHWSSSSHFVAAAFTVTALDAPLPEIINSVYQSIPLQETLISPRVTRGPPFPV